MSHHHSQYMSGSATDLQWLNGTSSTSGAAVADDLKFKIDHKPLISSLNNGINPFVEKLKLSFTTSPPPPSTNTTSTVRRSRIYRCRICKKV